VANIYCAPLRIKQKTKLRINRAKAVEMYKKQVDRIILDDIMNILLDLYEEENKEFYLIKIGNDAA